MDGSLLSRQRPPPPPPPPTSGAAASPAAGGGASSSTAAPRKKSRRGGDRANQKRRCVSTACVACRRRKSKCDGALPSCAACASVYGTECVYDPNSDHRRKGVYREKIDSMKARSSTLQILIEAILNAAEEDVPAIVKKIRTCDSLDDVAESILKEDLAGGEGGDGANGEGDDADGGLDDEYTTDQPVEGERDLARKMGELRLENGLVRFIGGTSHLIYLGDPHDVPREPEADGMLPDEEPLTSWTEVTKDTQLVIHLINMYFDWHYPYFTTLSKSLFYRDFFGGKPRGQPAGPTTYCSSLLVNAMLALGCHFTSVPGAFGIPGDSRTKGDHFFAEAKRLIVENDEYEKPRLTTVQALALMSVREAGCGREAKGWVYSGMSFRMAQDIGLNLDAGAIMAAAADPHQQHQGGQHQQQHAAHRGSQMDEREIDARRVTFWGCFLFDKCWSNYMGRLPQLPKNSYNVPKYDVFPDEDAESWSPYTDAGFDQTASQPSRTRAAGLQLSKLCEISGDLMLFFYHPNHIGRSSGKSVELKKLSELHRRLEEWRKELPSEFEPKEGQLPNVILMHMFFHLQYIHLFRPFLRYSPSNSPLPAHVSPRRICTANAGAISKLMRLYKKVYNLRQICNIAVYMIHSACTIHLLNLPEKTARRDVIHGVRHLEEMSEDWLCARRTLSILSVLSRKWGVELPEEASAVLARTDEKYGTFSTADVPSPSRSAGVGTPSAAAATLASSSAAGGAYVVGSPAAPSPPQLAGQDDLVGASSSTSMSAALLGGGGGGLGSISPPPPQQRHQQQQQQTPKSVPAPRAGVNHSRTPSTLSMGDAMAALNAWALPPTIPAQQQSIPPAYHPFVGAGAGGNMVVGSSSGASPATGTTSSTATATATRQVSPNSLFAVDGQDWFLKDSVNWHQNFETWGLGGGGTGTAAADPSSMYMFRGFRTSPGVGGSGSGGGGLGDLDMAAFDSLDATMDELDHLSGLD